MDLKRVKKRVRGIPVYSDQEDLDVPLDGDLEVRDAALFTELRILVDEQVVSSLRVLDLEQQIGGSTVRMAGIAAVETHPRHRRKDCCRRLMWNTLRWARQEGYDTTQLFGIPAFYPKFGYVQAFPDTRFTITVRDAETLQPGGHRFVPYEPKYLQAMLRMHQRGNLGRTGPVRRDPKRWGPDHGGWRWPTQVALSKTGKPVGYFVFEAEHYRVRVVEAGWSEESVLPDIVLSAARIAAELRLDIVSYILPEDHELMDFCRPLRLWKRVTHRKESGGQVRLVNTVSTLNKLAGDIGSRLDGSGSLNIITNLDKVRISWSEGTCAIGAPDGRRSGVRMPQWALAQLLYGYRTARSLRLDGVLQGPAAGIEALEQMFPISPHFFYAVDAF